MAVVSFPRIDALGAQPHADLFGMGDRQPLPGVACRACGRSWPDVSSFFAAG